MNGYVKYLLHSVVAAVFVFLPAAARSDVILTPVAFQEWIGFAGTLAEGADDALPEHLVLSLDIPGTGLMQGFAHSGGGATPRAEISYRIDFGSSASSAVADVIINYEFAVVQVEGDPFTGLVPVVINTAGSASVSLAGYGSAFARLTYPGGQIETCTPVEGSCLADPFDQSIDIEVLPETALPITMRARGVNGVGLPAGESIEIHALLDPMITIDPDFALANQFRVIFSPGLCADPFCTQASNAPEPTALAIFACGLVVLGFMRRRRRAA